jgi:hypothetical protein
MFGLPAVADDVRSLALRTTDETGMKQLGNRLRLVSNRGGCKHPDGVARLVGTALDAFADEVALHLDHRCSVAGRRAEPLLPVPATRIPELDRKGRDFS